MSLIRDLLMCLVKYVDNRKLQHKSDGFDKEEDDFDGHPFGIKTALDPEIMQYADKYVPIYGPEMNEVGIYWELEGCPHHEVRNASYEILFNPKFEFERGRMYPGDSIEVI